MLLKKIIARYGTSTSGAPFKPQDDMIHAALDHFTGDVRDLIAFRTSMLEKFSVCRPFHLDVNAAAYVDSYVDDIRNDPENFMRDIKLPEEVVWVEYDARGLGEFQLACGSRNDPEEVVTLGRRGAIFDNRNPDHLEIHVFLEGSDGNLVDPMTRNLFKKDRSGYPASQSYEAIPTQHTFRFLELTGQVTQEVYEELVRTNQENTAHVYQMSYGLFALIASLSDDVVMAKAPVFSAPERKKAAKFGKRHVLKAPNEAITIRLGAPGMAYVRQIKSDGEARRAEASGRTAPVRHEVREHIRVYRSGKIVTVKAHIRGQKPDRRETFVTAVEPAPRENLEDGPSL